MGEIKSVQVYPNPTNGQFYFKSEEFDFSNCNLKVYDLSGRLVSVKIKKQNERMMQVELSQIPIGVYMYRLTLENGDHYMGQIIKE